MIRSGLILMIRKKAQSGQSPYAIGKEMGTSKNTAKKYVTGNFDLFFKAVVQSTGKTTHCIVAC